MEERNRNALDELKRVMQGLDEAFGADRAEQMGDFYTTDARLMWPFQADIVGRDAIQATFAAFMRDYTTLSWRPDRRTIALCGDAAFVIGTFIEDRALRESGEAERVFGRLVEHWVRDDDGEWRLSQLMTSRFAESETIPV